MSNVHTDESIVISGCGVKLFNTGTYCQPRTTWYRRTPRWWMQFTFIAFLPFSRITISWLWYVADAFPAKKKEDVQHVLHWISGKETCPLHRQIINNFKLRQGITKKWVHSWTFVIYVLSFWSVLFSAPRFLEILDKTISHYFAYEQNF